MFLEARFKRGSATKNRLTPFIPLKGDMATYHRCEYGKGHWPPLRGGRGVIQLEEELMQENLPLWVKNHAFKSMDKQNKQLKYSAIYFFQQTLM
jgi:hypothetical protein